MYITKIQNTSTELDMFILYMLEKNLPQNALSLTVHAKTEGSLKLENFSFNFNNLREWKDFYANTVCQLSQHGATDLHFLFTLMCINRPPIKD